jgi:hypothetical protein
MGTGSLIIVFSLSVFESNLQIYCPMHIQVFAQLCPDIELLSNIPGLEEIFALKKEILRFGWVPQFPEFSDALVRAISMSMVCCCCLTTRLSYLNPPRNSSML